MWQEIFRPPANIQQMGTEALSPTTCKEWSPAYNHVRLEVDPSSSEPSEETLALADTLVTQFVIESEQRSQLSCAWTP